MYILGQTVGNMVEAVVNKKKFQPLSIFVEVDVLFKELSKVFEDVHHRGWSATLKVEEEVLKRFQLDNPVDDANWDPSDLRLLRTEVEALGRIDSEQQYGLIRHGEYEPKPFTSPTDVVTCWPKEVWAAVMAARDGVQLKDMQHHEIEYFRERGF